MIGYAEFTCWRIDSPEYPQNPTVHRKRPTVIRIKGRITHWEVDLRAGQRNEAKGKAGFEVPLEAS